MTIPFFDLRHQYNSLQPQMDARILDCIRESELIRGKDVVAFEKLFGHYLNGAHVIATGNGTDSLFIALKVLGTGVGDEVITPAFSWISSAETISQCGGKPVFVDVDPSTYTIDIKKIEEKISAKTKGIVAVHLYGQAAHIHDIQKLCRRYNLFLIEDCAQAHLTVEHDLYAGTIGDIGTFSFYPTKNLGAYGDAGAIVTQDAVLAERARRFANHGALYKDDHLIKGINSRMDTLQAAVLALKLPHLGRWNSLRVKNASLYNSMLRDVEGITLPYLRENAIHTFHIYAIRVKSRKKLQDYLKQHGVQTMVHYPLALPNLPAYLYLKHTEADFPVASVLQEEVLSLPIYPELTEEQLYYVCKNIKEFYA